MGGVGRGEIESSTPFIKSLLGASGPPTKLNQPSLAHNAIVELKVTLI